MITRLEELPNCEPLHTGPVETGVSIFQYFAFISVSATNTKRYAAVSEMGVCLAWKSTVVSLAPDTSLSRLPTLRRLRCRLGI